MDKRQLELPLFEEWLPIEGYNNYEVSNFGKIKSVERIDSLGRTVKERILKQVTNKYGYQQVCLCKDGKKKMFRVHRLVASAFIPNPNNYPVVNHKDEVKTNNHVSNLEWCTVEYNNNYGTRNDRYSGENHPKPMLGKFGKDNPTSKQVIQLMLDGEVIKIWGSTREIKRELGYNNSSISACCRGKRKSAYKYKWCYA